MVSLEQLCSSDETAFLSLYRDGAHVANDPSNRRFDIWMNSLELTACSPIVGASHFNILDFARDRLPQSYIITNEHMCFDTMHNVFLDVLLSQGIVGLLLFFAIIVYSLIFIAKHWRALFFSPGGAKRFLCFAVMASVVAGSFFVTEIVYVISPFTLYFWLSFGYLMNSEVKNENN
jgi:O-antigen ligase